MREFHVAVAAGPLQALGYMSEEIPLIIEVDEQCRTRRICRGRSDELEVELHRMVAGRGVIELLAGVLGDVFRVAEEVSVPMDAAEFLRVELWSEEDWVLEVYLSRKV